MPNNLLREFSTLRIVFDGRIGFHSGKDGHDHLVRSFALELREPFIELSRFFLRNDPGVVIEIAGRFRRNDFGGRDFGGEKDAKKNRG